MQQHAVENAEDRGVHTYAQREHRERQECERGTSPKSSPGIPRVLEQRSQGRAGETLTHTFLNLLQALKLKPRRSTRLRRGHTAGDELIHNHLETRSKLFVQVF